MDLSDEEQKIFEKSVTEFCKTYDVANPRSYKTIFNEETEKYELVCLLDQKTKKIVDSRHRWLSKSIFNKSLDPFCKWSRWCVLNNKPDGIFITGWNNRTLFCEWFNKPKPVIRDNFYFYTFTGSEKIPDTDENIEKMKNICNNIFNNENWKRFRCVHYNIECGKHQDDSNLHIHALIDFEKTNKNFERDFTRCWTKEFKSFGLDFKKGGKQHFKGKNVNHIWDDKLAYLRNDDKSILHQNYRDLGIFHSV